MRTCRGQARSCAGEHTCPPGLRQALLRSRCPRRCRLPEPGSPPRPAPSSARLLDYPPRGGRPAARAGPPIGRRNQPPLRRPRALALPEAAGAGRPPDWSGPSPPSGLVRPVSIPSWQPIGDAILVRLALAGFWPPDLRSGARQELSLEHPLGPWLLSRLEGSGWWPCDLAAGRGRAIWRLSPPPGLVLRCRLPSPRSGPPGPDRSRDLARPDPRPPRRPPPLRPRRGGARVRLDRSSEWNLHRAHAVILRLEIQFDASAGPSPG